MPSPQLGQLRKPGQQQAGRSDKPTSQASEAIGRMQASCSLAQERGGATPIERLALADDDSLVDEGPSEHGSSSEARLASHVL